MPFVGARLRLGRTFRDYTLQQLAADVYSSATVLSQCENQKKEPRPELLAAISGVLGVTPEFFYLPVEDEFTDEECSFRRRVTTPERIKKRVLAHGTLFGEVVNYLNQVLSLPAFNVPQHKVSSMAQVEDAADRTRLHWGLGLEAPILSVGRVLERAGVVLTRFEAESEKVDAFSRFGDVSLIVLNTTKRSPSRTLMDIAHEAGHLVMHRGMRPNTPEREAEAERFGSAFLLPRRGFARDFHSIVGERLDWERLFEMKRHWRASVAAIIRRAYDLELIDALQYRRLNAGRASRGWHKQEPNEPAAEKPELVEMAFERLEKDTNQTLYDVALKLNLKPQTLAEITGLPLPNRRGSDRDIVSLDVYRDRRTNLS